MFRETHKELDGPSEKIEEEVSSLLAFYSKPEIQILFKQYEKPLKAIYTYSCEETLKAKLDTSKNGSGKRELGTRPSQEMLSFDGFAICSFYGGLLSNDMLSLYEIILSVKNLLRDRVVYPDRSSAKDKLGQNRDRDNTLFSDHQGMISFSEFKLSMLRWLILIKKHGSKPHAEE